MKSWWWLGRANVALFVALLICANKVVNGFTAPGWPSAGAFGIFAVLCFGFVFAALANAVAGALILADHKPAFAEWFRARRSIGCFLTALAAIPIGAALLYLLGVLLKNFQITSSSGRQLLGLILFLLGLMAASLWMRFTGQVRIAALVAGGPLALVAVGYGFFVAVMVVCGRHGNWR